MIQPTHPPVDQPDDSSPSGTPPLSRDHSGDALDALNGDKNPGTAIPQARDGFFGYTEERSIRSVRSALHFLREKPDPPIHLPLQIEEKYLVQKHGSHELLPATQSPPRSSFMAPVPLSPSSFSRPASLDNISIPIPKLKEIWDVLPDKGEGKIAVDSHPAAASGEFLPELHYIHRN